jgi:DNA-binding MarR family transcriptional regulator
MAASFRMDRYVSDVLLRDLVSHDRSPATFLVYFFLAAKCGSVRNRKVRLSLADIADRTGLSKRAVQTALARLRRRHLITSIQDHRTATPVHAVLRPWRARA